MKIVFSNEKNRISGDKITIEDEKDFKHLKKVQRVRIGEEILFYQVEEETQYKAKVVDFGKHSIILRVLSSEKLTRSKPEIYIIQALVQKGTFEDELNRLSELGVDYLQPIISKHSQNFSFDERYMNRLKRISYEGAKTVGNPFPTVVLKPFSITKNYGDLKNFISSLGMKTELLLFTNRAINNSSIDFLDVIPTLKGSERIVVCVGSEGGFTEDEEDNIASFGFKPVNLGRRILLRSDTVCIGVSFVLRLLKQVL